MWSRLGNAFSVHQQNWPAYEEALATVETVEIPIQINGKVRDKIVVESGLDQDALLTAAKTSARIQQQIAGKTIVKEISVPGRLVNIVVR
jgi:leucyl-tRNA synthetase